MQDYQLIRSNRRSVSISISKELRIIVRAPLRLSKQEIDRFVEQHADWIDAHTALLRERVAQLPPPLTDAQIVLLRQKAKLVLPEKVSQYAQKMEVTPTGITITSATTRWGSCSSKNRLSFPYRLMLLPDPLIDYIVVHELAHIREKNHSARFYAVVAAYLPDYKERVALLKQLPPMPMG